MNHWPEQTRQALIECLGQERAESFWERIDQFVGEAFTQWRGDTFEQQHRADTELAGMIHRGHIEATDAGAEAEGYIHSTLSGWRGEDEIFAAINRLAATGTPIPREVEEKQPDVAAAMADLVKKEVHVSSDLLKLHTEEGQAFLADVRSHTLARGAAERENVANWSIKQKNRYRRGEIDLLGNEIERYVPAPKPPEDDDGW